MWSRSKKSWGYVKLVSRCPCIGNGGDYAWFRAFCGARSQGSRSQKNKTVRAASAAAYSLSQMGIRATMGGQLPSLIEGRCGRLSEWKSLNFSGDSLRSLVVDGEWTQTAAAATARLPKPMPLCS